jgi:hypothetical protein
MNFEGHCQDLATATELACPKCKMFGCDCHPPEAHGRNAMVDTCMVCRRPKALCICRSHMAMTPLPDTYEPSGPARRKLSRKEIESRVNEAVHLYYEKHPQGLAALVRGWFQ